MSLRGSLSDFGMGDIFQLIVAQRKTGDLVVRGGSKGEVTVGFEAGRIVSLAAQRPRRESLGQRLLRGQLVSGPNLKRALKAQRKTKQPLGEILKAHKSVAVADIDALLALQRRETILGIFELSRGDYRFDPKAYKGGSGTPPLLDANSVLMEAVRRLEEWPIVRARISNFGTRFKLTGRSAPALDVTVEESSLGGEESFGDWGSLVGSVPDEAELARVRVRELVDGRLTVSDVVDRSCLGEFETCKALVSLWDSGEIEPTRVMRAVERPGLQQGLSVRRLALTVLTNVLIVGSVVALYLVLPQSTSRISSDSQHAVQQSLERLRDNRLGVISAALEVHRIRHGVYPAQLSEMVEAGLLDAALLMPPDGRPLEYVGIGSDYDLR